uniref:NR LBD domain-containing protein n=1 Tax=Caenorhabditis tropicalis TaxID=1561998 RepID=A0A1I7UEZ6_9PELO
MANRRTNMTIRQLELYTELREELRMFRIVTRLQGENFPGGIELRLMERVLPNLIDLGRGEWNVRDQQQVMELRRLMSFALRRFLDLWGM